MLVTEPSESAAAGRGRRQTNKQILIRTSSEHLALGLVLVGVLDAHAHSNCVPHLLDLAQEVRVSRASAQAAHPEGRQRDVVADEAVLGDHQPGDAAE